jgi:hypothetical protein
MSQEERKGSAPTAVQERFGWHVATRDDAAVAQALSGREAIEEMHERSEAGLLDECFAFLQESGMMAVLEQHALPGVQRVLIPTVQCVLLSLLKGLVGAESMHAWPRVLFSNVALMERIGFTAHHIEAGLTKRGDGQRNTKKKQGPWTAQCVADTICTLTREQMERLFHQMVQVLVGKGRLDGKRLVALDGSTWPTPATDEGAGTLTHTRSVKIKGQKERATEEDDVSGFNVLGLIDVQTRLPLARNVVQSQE